MENYTENEITLNDILRILKRRKYWIFGITLLTLFATLIYLFYFAKPVYEITAIIKLPRGSSAQTVLSPQLTFLSVGQSPALTEQMEIMKSRRVLTSVVNDLNLIEYFSKKSKGEVSQESVVSMLSKNVVNVSSVKDTSLIKLTVSLEDKEMAYKIARSVIDNYIDVARALNKDENTYLLEFVESQLPKVEKELTEIENKLLNFQKTKSILPSEELSALIRKFHNLDSRIIETQLNYQNLQSQLQVLKQNISQLKGMIKILEYVPDSAKLQELRKRLLDLQISYNTLSLTYTKSSPEMRQIEQQMNIVQQMINEEISRILSSQFETEDPILRGYYLELINLQTNIEVAKSYISSLEHVRKELEKELQKFPDLQREYATLMRDYNLKQQTYTLLKSKREELRLSTAGMSFNVPIVLDEPYIPERPTKPNKRLILAVAFVLGVFLGVLIAFLREAFDEKIRDEYDVLKTVGEEPLLYQPSKDGQKDLEALKHIFVQALNSTSTESSHVHLLVSSTNSSWKAPIIEGIVELLSKACKKTVLVDLDGRSKLPLNSREVKIVSFNGEFLTFSLNDKQKNILQDVAQGNDVVVLSAPAPTSADTKALASQATQTVLILKANESKKSDLLCAMKNLEKPKLILVKEKSKKIF
ncbi:GumC family protein [Pseudothermotoga sp.]